MSFLISGLYHIPCSSRRSADALVRSFILCKMSNSEMTGYNTYRGGPVNQGNPDSRYMSDAERGSVFSRFVQYKLLTELCEPQWRTWRECIRAKNKEWFSTFKCRGDFNVVNECQNKYILDPVQMKLLEEEYLQLRSEFRRTGVGHQFMTKDQMHKYFGN